MSQAAPIADAEPEAAPPPRRRLGWTFWAGLTFGLVCILVGLVIGIMGSRLVPAGPDLGQPPKILPEEPRRSPVSSARPAAVAPAAPADPTDTEARIAQLEAQRRDQASRSAASTALSALRKAAEGELPFAGQVDAVSRALPATPELAALRELAALGAPTRATLAARFPEAAADAVIAARAPPPGAGFLAKVGDVLTRLVTIRRTSRLTGTDPDAVLARAQRAAAGGDLDAALREIAALPPAAREVMSPWRGDAERRTAIDRRLAAVAAGAGATP